MVATTHSNARNGGKRNDGSPSQSQGERHVALETSARDYSSVTSKVETPQLAGIERIREGKTYVPATDIYETPQAIVLLVDLPGVEQEDLDVSLEKNVLTIRGAVKPYAPAGMSQWYSEYGLGNLERRFTISNHIDWEHISGTLNDGVLTLHLPKAGPAQAKRIDISAK